MEGQGPGMFGVASMDIRCRCTTVGIVDDIAPTLRRDNTKNEERGDNPDILYVEYGTYAEWLEAVKKRKR